MNVKERVSHVIKARDLKRYQFAESIGVSQPTISNWFNKGNGNPSLDSLSKIAYVHTDYYIY